MIGLIAAAASFLGIHLLVSGTALRDVITARIGEKRYTALFALASLAALVWLCIAYDGASASKANTVLFVSPTVFKGFGVIAIAAAIALAVPGVLRGNPTSAGQRTAPLGGMLRVTRHPFLMGVTVWSAFHLAAMGTLAATVFFATFLILAVFGTHAIDRKAERRQPSQWRQITAQTSVIPFVAIAERRNRFSAPEVIDWRMTVAVIAFALLLYFHQALFSAAPLPAQWLAFLTAH
jgi:uncharacterized membrane protein